MPSYLYSPLPLEADSIRLLRLLPDRDEAAPIQCELWNYSLWKPGSRTHMYEAISYVWGNPRQTLPIFVDKKQFHVTVNLHAALSHLRDDNFERIIWVDAICINQESPEEQGQQVQLMAKIYSYASRVIVWLGNETTDTKGALEEIQLAADEELIARPKKRTNQQAVLNLLRRPWFQRVWVRE
jgi:hypothetical protein